MPAGAPTKYDYNLDTKEYEDGYTIRKTMEYIESFKDDDVQVIPSVAGLALHLSVSKRTIHGWGSEDSKEQFLHTLDILQAKQELLLLNSGLSGNFNSNIAKLALANHGYADKQDIGISENTLTPWEDIEASQDG